MKGYDSVQGVKASGTRTSEFEDDEYVIYNPNQVFLSYLVRFPFVCLIFLINVSSIVIKIEFTEVEMLIAQPRKDLVKVCVCYIFYCKINIIIYSHRFRCQSYKH